MIAFLERRSHLFVAGVAVAFWASCFALVVGAFVDVSRVGEVLRGASLTLPGERFGALELEKLDGAASPAIKTAAIVLNAVTSVPLVPSAYTTPTSGRCTNDSVVSVWVVQTGVNSNAAGDGPFCSTCNAGPVFPVPGKASAIAGGAVTIRCQFVDDGTGYGGVFGTSLGTVTALFCKLTGGAGCTMTGNIIFSGVASPDVDTGTGDTFQLRSGGASGVAGDIELWARGGIVDFMSNTGASTSIRVVTATDVIEAVGAIHVGRRSNQLGNALCTTLGDNAAAFKVYCSGIQASEIFTATLTAPTELGLTPLSTHTVVSATAPTSFTPNENGAVDGWEVWVVNDTAFPVTMTAIAARYEAGPVPCVLNQWDAVRFRYVVDRYVEESCENRGSFRATPEQLGTCAAGVLALDPQSSQITVDANGAACVVTLAETTAALEGPGFFTTIAVTNAGAGLVTFPDAANVNTSPALCSTAGLAANGVLALQYMNRANDLWVATACLQSP